MSSELFETRGEDYRQIHSDTRKKLSEELPRYPVGSEMHKKLTREIRRNIEEARVLIQEMEHEVRKAPASFRSQMLASVRTYRQEVDQLSSNLACVLAKGSSSNVSFGFYAEDEIEKIEDAKRAQMIQGTSSLVRASDSLARTHMVASETDAIGNEIIEELGSQRESLLRTQNRLGETDEELVKSRKILNQLSRSILTNKLLLVLIILAELGILGGVLYWKISTRK